ncbi:tRNA-specific adenosine deaminase 1-like isoform X2 [Neocloeon triangulifer]|uniref:tRNA-specific adenosine deaminase 1-like isoform X2 n=1 Tax=Neocloeon triangulifer TaxID=2078957 RepID=UPI00286EEFDE|nr:tRNA-specific adenosine deaminase 1-like isoform X2 [Neocloeon triangulifer]
MSAFVLEKTDGSVKVVSLGTGSKCLGKNELSKDGGLVSDSHAEVLARRTFLLYLYGQLSLLGDGQESEVFEKSETGKAHLKPAIRFHLFTSHTPCGDASIIPKDDPTEPPNKKVKLLSLPDVHRTGAKCVPGGPQDPLLPGQDYHTVLAIRTKPGRGDPTISLSCSDKISKWCAIGVQGALLSMLVEQPIYLTSIILPSNCPYSEESMVRAIVSRLPKPCSPPQFFRSTLEFIHCKVPGKPCPVSLLWSDTKHLFGDQCFQVAVDGRKHGLSKAKATTTAGRLKVCKAELHLTFEKVSSKLGLNFSKCTYRQLKDKADIYQNRWEIIKSNSFPEWPKKEAGFEEFPI